MTKESILIHQKFRSNLNFLQDFFKTELPNDIHSGDKVTQISLESSIANTYPLVLDVSNDLLSDGKIAFETHVLSFLYYHQIDAGSTMRIYYAIGHRCDYDKNLNSIGLSTPNHLNIYAIVVQGQKVLTITARQLGKNRSQFEKNLPIFMCSNSFLPPSPLLIEDSAYLESLYITVSKETKKYFQAFNSALEALNTTVLEYTKHQLNKNTLYLYLLKYLSNHELANQHQLIIENLIANTVNIASSIDNPMTFIVSEGTHRKLPSAHNSNDFFLQTFDRLQNLASTKEEIDAIDQFKKHFNRHLGYDLGPLSLDKIIKKPVTKIAKPPINEYDIKDVSTRPFSLNRIQPINTLLTDQTYEIANTYQGQKDAFTATEWSSNAFPILLAERVTNQNTAKDLFHFHFIAFTVKESYTKAITPNTMYRYLGYGYPFYFDGQKFCLDQENLKIYGFIFKKGSFSSFSEIDYLSIYETEPTSISLNGKRPTQAIEKKLKSVHDTLGIAIKKREELKESCINRLEDINASYTRYLRKNKKQANARTAIDYISNMMLRTAKEEYKYPELAKCITATEYSESMIKDTAVKFDSEIKLLEEQIESNPVETNIDEVVQTQDANPIQDNHDDSQSDYAKATIMETNTPCTQLTTQQSYGGADIDKSSDLQEIESEETSKTIHVQQTINSSNLPPIIEKNLNEQQPFEIKYIHTPNINKSAISDKEIQNIIDLTKPIHQPTPDNYSFNVDRSEIFPTANSSQDLEDNGLKDQPSLLGNLAVFTVDWSTITHKKYLFEGLSIAVGSKKIYIRETDTEHALEFKVKHLLNKGDDYYFLKRAVGKDIAKDLRKFIKLKRDQDFISRFCLI